MSGNNGTRGETRKYFSETAATKDGWRIEETPDGFRLTSAEGSDRFPSDEAVREHVIAEAWAGLSDHSGALSFLERFAPDEFDRIGAAGLREASISYRKEETARYREAEAEVRSRSLSDPDFKAAATDAYLTILAELSERYARVKKIESFNAHLSDEVARQCMIVAMHDGKTPEEALDHARRRMLLTATPTAFYGEQEPRREIEEARP